MTGVDRTGVVAVAIPIADAAGHVAGFWLNACSVHACWIVVNLAGRALGSVTATLRVLACPAPDTYFTLRLAPCFLLVLACVDTVNFGVNSSSRHPPAWKRLARVLLVPCVLVTLPVICMGVQLVGLNVNPGRSNVTSTRRTRSGMPSRIVGNGSDTAVTCAVRGSILRDCRTLTIPRLNGPATAGTCTTNPYGPPLYGPVKNALPGIDNGFGPAP